MAVNLPAPPDWWKKYKPLRWLMGLTVIVAVTLQFWEPQPEMKAGTTDFGKFENPVATVDTTPVAAPAAGMTDDAAPAPVPAPVANAPVPVKLLDQFSSYDGFEKTKATLEAAGYTTQTRRNRKPRSKKYPPRDIDTLTAAGYKHLEVKGTLSLDFFNDRLMTAIFDAEQAVPYAKALHESEPLLKRDKIGTAQALEGPRRVVTNVDFSSSAVGRAAGSSAWAMWQDMRLVKLRDEWEAQFGLLTP